MAEIYMGKKTEDLIFELADEKGVNFVAAENLVMKALRGYAKMVRQPVQTCLDKIESLHSEKYEMLMRQICEANITFNTGDRLAVIPKR